MSIPRGPLYSDEQMNASHEREQDAISALEYDDPTSGVAQVYATLALVAAVRSLRETVDDLRRQLP